MSGAPSFVRLEVKRLPWWNRIDPASIARSSANGTLRAARFQPFFFDLDTLIINAVKPTKWYVDPVTLAAVGMSLGGHVLRSDSVIGSPTLGASFPATCYDALGRVFAVSDLKLNIYDPALPISYATFSPLATVHNGVPYSVNIQVANAAVPLNFTVGSFFAPAGYPAMTMEPQGRWYCNSPVVTNNGTVTLPIKVTDAVGRTLTSNFDHPYSTT